ncbi:MAG: sulfatase-like hydrolase/transferase [Planctomycetales bacterium]|nr:sulfatase-like hydrolase/transferase [Planctomycetales bacterium]
MHNNTGLLAAAFILLLNQFSWAGPTNIVFIMADDLGWADVGFHGGNAPTPFLDKMCAEGLELTHHYVAPVCSPTRTGLMTGRFWSRFGVVSPQNERALPWETTTLATALKSVGYQTCLIGKWHLGSTPTEGPNHFGFDHSYGSLAGGVSPWNHRYKQGPFTETWHRNEMLIAEPGHVTDLLRKEAISWLESHSNKPFFMYVPFTAVHLPVKEPIEWVNKVPDSIQGEVSRHYAASIMHLDDAVKQIVNTLERLGVRDNTLIVFTSDNGGSTAENNDLKYPDDNCPNGVLPGNNLPLRGQKGTLYEGGIRVPTIVSWRGAKPGKIDEPMHITDWMPTFCELANYSPTRSLGWDGESVLSVLQVHSGLPEREFYSVAPGWRGQALRVGEWKLIKSDSQIELFNLKSDPSESKNVASENGELLEKMKLKLEEIAMRDRESEVKH